MMGGLDDVATLLSAASGAAERELRALYLATARSKLAGELQKMSELQALLAALEGELTRTAVRAP